MKYGTALVPRRNKELQMTTETKQKEEKRYYLGEISGEENYPMLEAECKIQVFENYKDLKIELAQRVKNSHCEKNGSPPFFNYKLVLLDQTRGDTWHKIYAQSSAEAHEIVKRITYEIIPVDVFPPGTHPGGEAWWVEPMREEICVLGLISPEAFDAIEDKSSLKYWNLFWS